MSTVRASDAYRALISKTLFQRRQLRGQITPLDRIPHFDTQPLRDTLVEIESMLREMIRVWRRIRRIPGYTALEFAAIPEEHVHWRVSTDG